MCKWVLGIGLLVLLFVVAIYHHDLRVLTDNECGAFSMTDDCWERVSDTLDVYYMYEKEARTWATDIVEKGQSIIINATATDEKMYM
jgi:hypothetical protein